jgi:predicted phage terminase large subunit-like protein
MQAQQPILPLRKTQLEQLKLDEKLSAVRAACNVELVSFGETLYPGWVAGRFHEYLGEELEKCLTGETKRLAISVPAQHGKSRESSVIFPARALTKRPTLKIFQAGFNGDLSKGFCREARQIVTSERYLQLYPSLIHPAVNRQDYWQTKLGGYYYTTSVGGGTGMPADILIIDDPHKNREEADSPTMRQKVWDWVTSVALPRLSPNGVLIVIQTRWHDDDLIGRLTNPERVKELEESGFNDLNFKVIKLPALCEDPETDPLGRKEGEALWPEVRNTRFLEGKKLEIGIDEFNALFQQRPRRQGGNEVDINDIVIIEKDDLPPELVLARGWDLALTAEQASDYSAGARGGVIKYKIPLETAEDGKVLKWVDVEDFYLVHMHHGKRKWAEQKHVIVELGEAEAPTGNVVGLETVAGFKIGASELQTAFQGRCIVKSINVHKDKVARANAWMAKIPVKRFFMVRGPWNKAFLSELHQFPNGVHDDQVDAVSVLYETVHKKKVHYLT